MSSPRPPLSVVGDDAKVVEERLDPLVFSEGAIAISKCESGYGFSTRTAYRLVEERKIISALAHGRRVLCRRSVRRYLQRQIDNDEGQA